MATTTYSTFSSISQSTPSRSAYTPTRTASLGPSNIAGSSIGAYESQGRTVTFGPVATSSESTGGGGKNRLGMGLGIGFGVGAFVVVVLIAFLYRSRHLSRKSFEQRTRHLQLSMPRIRNASIYESEPQGQGRELTGAGKGKDRRERGRSVDIKAGEQFGMGWKV